MNAIAPYAHILDIDFGKDVLKKIELVGRTCYKSTDKITDESAPIFVANLMKREHEAMLEHASFCFMLTNFGEWNGLQVMAKNFELHHGFKSFLRFTNENRYLVSGNVRAWRNFMKACVEDMDCLPWYMERFIKEHPVLFPEFQKVVFFGNKSNTTRFTPVYIDDLKSENEFLTHCDVTVRFVVDRGVSHEIVRHRPASFAQESTRYCNYSKDKFGGEITFIIPEFFQYGSTEWKLWKAAMEQMETVYMSMINYGVTPEKARSVLPNSLKTELIMTASCAEWKHFFGLRACNYTGKAHPQMLEVSRPLLDEFKNTISVVFDELTYGE